VIEAAVMGGELGLFSRPATRRFLRALYGSAPTDSLVEVRFRVASGMGQCFHRAAALERVAATITALASRTDVYVGVVPRASCAGGRRDLVEHADALWADCDTTAAITALGSFRPLPALVVASGSGQNCHAYWLLREPINIDRLERLNRRLAVALGADARSSDAARILRPAGSLNRKHSPPAPVRLLVGDERRRIAIGELERGLPPEPESPRASTKLRTSRDAPIDALRSVAPALYVERLTGQRVGRSRKVRCPFHDDQTPSLHVYEDADRGWYCFGCARGGSIYDLAALLWQRETRGEDFLALRRELAALVS
jgi:hypothetical protein